jgi:hypothetical protein
MIALPGHVRLSLMFDTRIIPRLTDMIEALCSVVEVHICPGP